jgi:predicted nucleic acid-binding protein
MNQARGPVVIDTGVFSARLGRREGFLDSAYRPVLEGRPAIVSFATVAELLYGAKVARWGSRRLSRLEHELGRAKTVWAGPELVEQCATLRAWCANKGHGLHQKDHDADRWVAATAMRLGVPLVAHDAIFKNIAGLELITTLAND